MEIRDPLYGRRLQALFSNDRVTDSAGLEYLKELHVAFRPDSEISRLKVVLEAAGLTASENLLGEVATFLTYESSFEELELELIDRRDSGESISYAKRRGHGEYNSGVKRIFGNLPAETLSTGHELAERLKEEIGVEVRFYLIESLMAELDPPFIFSLPDRLNEISPESNQKEISVRIQRNRSMDTSGLPEKFLLTDLPLMLQVSFAVLYDSFSRIKEALDG